MRATFLFVSILSNSAFAGVYGEENWGEMYWGDNPVTAPGSAPTIISAVADEDEITITLDDFPIGTGADGWSAITSFTVTCGDFSTETTENQVIITGLESDTEYACSVIASNAIGASPNAVRVVTTSPALQGINFLLICSAIDCGSNNS